MEAAVLHEPGTTPRFGTYDDPVAHDENEAVVEVTAGLNPVDLIVAAGRSAEALPLVPGLEGVGWHQRRRVYFTGAREPFGSMAERTIVAHTGVMGLPDDLDDGTTTALGISGLAAWLPLSWRAELQPGETVLVLGATGVLGTIAVQAARLLGRAGWSRQAATPTACAARPSAEQTGQWTCPRSPPRTPWQT